MPPFTAGLCSFSFAKSVRTFAAATGSFADDETGRALEPLADETALVHRAKRQRVLDDDVLDAAPCAGGGEAPSSASR